jgi:hypothetical protein
MNIKIIILLLVLLLLISILNNKELFDNHINCGPDHTLADPINSHKSLLKGPCTKYKPYSYSDMFNFDNDNEEYVIKSRNKCSGNYSRNSAKNSYNSESKSWCSSNDL